MVSFPAMLDGSHQGRRTAWSAADARELYNVARWSDGYFDVTADGHVSVHPTRDGEGPSVRLRDLVARFPQEGLTPPVLLRFPGILRDRLAHLQEVFREAIAERGYAGGYSSVYPIKVNQHRTVVEEIVASGCGPVGLEAGSKPELMAVLAMAPPGGTIVCNGYKDPEYVRLALRGRQLGFDIHLVLEKPSEAPLVVREVQRLGVNPQLGLRVRLSSVGAGKWQNTGGERSKFGLGAAEALRVLEELRAHDLVGCLGLLHFHLGSQIANIHDIRRAVTEGARVYADLHALGAPMATLDVGGGLGVDYEGTRSRNFCSMNYTLEEYAHNVVEVVATVCEERSIPHPHLMTESGRAMTAHHAVLVAPVNDVASPAVEEPEPPGEEAPAVLQRLYRVWSDARAGRRRAPTEIYHDACHEFSEAQSLYLHGLLDLDQRAWSERCHQAIGRRLLQRLDARQRDQREARDELNRSLADKLFVNFSVFQSIPDVWAIDQIFPIMPLHGLDHPAERRGVVEDLTCDSDGTVSLYVDGEGIESTLPLPAAPSGERLWLGIFLVGAYQEILGDRHNLFGDTDSVNVEVGAAGASFQAAQRGDTVTDVLRAVGFDERELAGVYRRRVAEAGLPEGVRRVCLAELEAGLQGYTYLED